MCSKVSSDMSHLLQLLSLHLMISNYNSPDTFGDFGTSENM
jgi:hypothetical protein